MRCALARWPLHGRQLLQPLTRCGDVGRELGIGVLPEFDELPVMLGGPVRVARGFVELPKALVDAEIRAMESVRVAPTEDRAVLGCLVDFVKTVPDHLDVGAWDLTTLPFVEARLAETPCHLGRALIWPARTASELLAARWVT